MSFLSVLSMSLCVHSVNYRVPEFEVSKYLVSNREFFEFVKDNGYQRKELWTEEGKQLSYMD